MNRFLIVPLAVVLSVVVISANGCSKSVEPNKETSMNVSGVAELVKTDMVVGTGTEAMAVFQGGHSR